MDIVSYSYEEESRWSRENQQNPHQNQDPIKYIGRKFYLTGIIPDPIQQN